MTRPDAANPEAPPSPDVIARHGIRPEEYDAIRIALGRDPNLVELGIHSVMWSEHCAYKHSRPLLRTLPTTGARVVVGPGENAGILDLGDGVGLVFKMESHNHPSAVEPYQGAATGVGGILRDIFTMGARPVALLDNLRFGEPEAAGMARLIEGVVEGIADYGNCVGVPTVGGDVRFDPAYAGNILVNVMCAGVADLERVTKAGAHGPGNVVIYYGSPTGRDGIHGATFASGELSDEARDRRGAVQVGDPFMGKKILEATLELIARGLVVGVQDMGAAGLTCSSTEMAGRAGTGIEIDLDRVPQRADGMTAYEIMLSESQERMLAVATPDRVDDVLAVCERWECDAIAIGAVTDTGRLVVRHADRVVADLPVGHLTDAAPTCTPPREDPPAPRPFGVRIRLRDEDHSGFLLKVLSSPNVASKRWVYRRFDHQVQNNTVVRPGEAAAAVVRLRGDERRADKFVALASGCNARFVARDPYVGAQLAVFAAARAVVSVGARPLGITNCLNFGSPERPAVYGQLERAIAGVGDACRCLDLPVTGGNVSLYNETDGVAIPPTPMIGMVGLLEKDAHVTLPGFVEEGDVIAVLGPEPASLVGSEFAAVASGHDPVGEPPRGELPPFSAEGAKELLEFLLRGIRYRLFRSACPVAEGGLAVALAECSLLSRGKFGAIISRLPGPDTVTAMFGELPARVVVTMKSDDERQFRTLCAATSVPHEVVGRVAGDALALLHFPPIPVRHLRAAHHARPTGRE